MVSGSKKTGAGARTHSAHPPRRKRARGRPGGGERAAIISAVLEAVLDALGTRGYARLSVEEVAVQAGVNKTSIYRRWPTKSELVRAALLALRDDETKIPDTGALGSDLLELLRRKKAKMSVPRGRSLLRALMADEDAELAALTRSLHEPRGGPPAMFERVFERAIARGELSARTDTSLLLELVSAPLYHRAFILQENVDDAFLARVIEAVLGGVLRRSDGNVAALRATRTPRAPRESGMTLPVVAARRKRA